jgi:hypothetical protein
VEKQAPEKVGLRDGGWKEHVSGAEAHVDLGPIIAGTEVPAYLGGAFFRSL